MPPQSAVWLKNAEETKLMSHWFSESDHLGPMCATCDQQSNKAVGWWNFGQELRKERLRRRSVNGKMQSGFLQYIHTRWLTGFFVHVVVSSIPAPLCAERFNETEWSEKLSWLVKNSNVELQCQTFGSCCILIRLGKKSHISHYDDHHQQQQQYITQELALLRSFAGYFPRFCLQTWPVWSSMSQNLKTAQTLSSVWVHVSTTCQQV